MPPGVPVFFSRMEYTGLHPFEPEAEPPSWEVLARLRLLLVTGIADPVAMRRMLARRGVFPVENQVFRDHHQFQENELALIAHKALRQKIDRIITTEKDYFRLRHLPGIAQWAAFRPLFPRMELTLLDTSNTAFYNWIGHYAERN
jgi:tetraacyldisaccharide-1-P 4'-kinase